MTDAKTEYGILGLGWMGENLTPQPWTMTLRGKLSDTSRAPEPSSDHGVQFRVGFVRAIPSLSPECVLIVGHTFGPQSDRNRVSLPVPLRELELDKSAVLPPPIPPCLPVSLKENDYESEGRRFESCRAR
jgi:hypothetical protein